MFRDRDCFRKTDNYGVCSNHASDGRDGCGIGEGIILSPRDDTWRAVGRKYAKTQTRDGLLADFAFYRQRSSRHVGRMSPALRRSFRERSACSIPAPRSDNILRTRDRSSVVERVGLSRDADCFRQLKRRPSTWTVLGRNVSGPFQLVRIVRAKSNRYGHELGRAFCAIVSEARACAHRL